MCSCSYVWEWESIWGQIDLHVENLGWLRVASDFGAREKMAAAH